VQSQRGLKNHFFHTHYLTTNEPLDVIVLLCYSFNCVRVSIQLLAAIQINQSIDWLIDWLNAGRIERASIAETLIIKLDRQWEFSEIFRWAGGIF